jgi:AcrR family transcriptional regulator
MVKIMPVEIKTGSLKDQIIAAASKVFTEEGYDSLSMRRVAQEAGCSQMAMYRHFDNKEALIQHICTQVYSEFAAKMQREIDAEDDPWQRLQRLIPALIRFAMSYPEHYALIFLVRHSDPTVSADRERLGKDFIACMRLIVEVLVPKETKPEEIDRKVRQILSCLHGTTALLIAHPKAYGLSKRKAIEDAESTFRSLFKR